MRNPVPAPREERRDECHGYVMIECPHAGVGEVPAEDAEQCSCTECRAVVEETPSHAPRGHRGDCAEDGRDPGGGLLDAEPVSTAREGKQQRGADPVEKRRPDRLRVVGKLHIGVGDEDLREILNRVDDPPHVVVAVRSPKKDDSLRQHVCRREGAHQQGPTEEGERVEQPARRSHRSVSCAFSGRRQISAPKPRPAKGWGPSWSIGS